MLQAYQNLITLITIMNPNMKILALMMIRSRLILHHIHGWAIANAYRYIIISIPTVPLKQLGHWQMIIMIIIIYVLIIQSIGLLLHHCAYMKFLSRL